VKAHKDTRLELCAGDGETADQISLSKISEYVRYNEKKGLIDPLDNIKEAKVWVGSTIDDKVFSQAIVSKAQTFYEGF
jgi:hypothetical protein